VRIVALAKHSLDVAEIRVNEATGDLRLTNVPERFGDIDKNVVEAAVRLKEAQGGSVTVLSVGPPKAQHGLKSIMAMGADDAMLVSDPFDGHADAAVLVRVVEAALRSLEPYDVVICGFASDDGYTWQLGPRLADRLSLPLIAHVRDFRSADGLLEIDRDGGDATLTVTTSLPAILTVAEEAFTPRAVTLLQAMKAQKRPISVADVQSDLGLALESLRELQPWSEVSRRGVVVPRKQTTLKGQGLVELADHLIDALIDEHALEETL